MSWQLTRTHMHAHTDTHARTPPDARSQCVSGILTSLFSKQHWSVNFASLFYFFYFQINISQRCVTSEKWRHVAPRTPTSLLSRIRAEGQFFFLFNEQLLTSTNVDVTVCPARYLPGFYVSKARYDPKARRSWGLLKSPGVRQRALKLNRTRAARFSASTKNATSAVGIEPQSSLRAQSSSINNH